MKDLIKQFAVGQNVNLVTGDDVADTDGTALQTNIVNILNVVIGFLGIVAVIIIIIGGVGYMTSSGDAGKVKKAKDTILYGVIGLVICVLSYAIVNWVIGSLLGNS